MHSAETACAKLQEAEALGSTPSPESDAQQLWHTGLTAVPWAKWKSFKSAPDDWNEHVMAPLDDNYVHKTSHVYGDGSLKGEGNHSQCGWAIVHKEGWEVLKVAYGPMPVAHPAQRTIKRAELWAFWHALRSMVPPMVYHTDQKGILDGFERGRGYCCGSSRPHADVWRMIWSILSQYELDSTRNGVSVNKVKSHVPSRVQATMPTYQLVHVKGNEDADHYAKRGADLDTEVGKPEALKNLGDKVQAAATMIGMVQKHLLDEDLKDADQLNLPKKNVQPELVVGPAEPHRMTRVRVKQKGKDQWRCTACKITTRSLRTLASLQFQQCEGSMIGRIKPHASHRVRETQGFVVCRACGVYGATVTARLRLPCLGGRADSAQKSGGQLSRLKRGLHPMSGKRLG